ncbi:MAG: HIT family protein [Sphingobacteriales bacterium]|nr:MAG: HIT family protein [Sphingobacteriales bacterium]
METIFSKIIAGEIPSYKVAEDDNFFAFLDIHPIQEGHVLIVPKKEVDKFFDADDELLREWLLFAKPIARAIEREFPCNRCGMVVVGLEVPHAHMHLIPINSGNDMNFNNPKLELTEQQFIDIQYRIHSHLHND